MSLFEGRVYNLNEFQELYIMYVPIREVFNSLKNSDFFEIPYK